jgi:hypothetical protein
MFKIEVFEAGRWSALGGRYATKVEADRKVVEFMACESKKRRRAYRVSRA